MSVGVLEEEVYVFLDGAENSNAADGQIRESESEYMIRAIDEYQKFEEVSNTIILIKIIKKLTPMWRRLANRSKRPWNRRINPLAQPLWERPFKEAVIIL